MMTYQQSLEYMVHLRVLADAEETKSKGLTGEAQLAALLRTRDWLKSAVAIAAAVAEVNRLRQCIDATAKTLALMGMPLAAKQIQDEIYASLR